MVCASAAELARAAAMHVAQVVRHSVAQRDWAYLALPGGPNARRIFEEMVLLQLPWDKVEFYFLDERCVPPVHPASNFGQASDILLENPRIGDHQFQRMLGEERDPAAEALRYAQTLPERFDLVLAELGSEGNLGSIFPHSAAFDADPDVRVVALEVPHKPRFRLALAPKVLADARDSLVYARGADHAVALHAALHSPIDVRARPAQLLCHGLWLWDSSCGASRAFGQ